MPSPIEQMCEILRAEGLLSSKRAPKSLDKLIERLKKEAGDRLIAFDTEIIADAEDYRWIFDQYQAATRSKDNVRIVSVFYDNEKQQAGASVIVNSVPFEASWLQEDDWVPAEFFSFVDKFSEKLTGRFAPISAMSQDYYAVYLPASLAEQFQELNKAQSVDETDAYLR